MKLLKLQNQTNQENQTNEFDLYVYGEIVGEKWYESDVDGSDFRNVFDVMESGDVLNIYINSGGGSVFTAVAICSIIDRLKAKNVTVNGFIDGICASAATFIAMACDALMAYKSSMMMIHKPIAMAYGNADELQKTIEMLNQIENNVMMPLYQAKSKISDEDILAMVDAETWLTADEMVDVFDISLGESDKDIAAIDRSCFTNYHNIPEALAEVPEVTEVEEPAETEEPTEEPVNEIIEEEVQETATESFDYTNLENRIAEARKGLINE